MIMVYWEPALIRKRKNEESVFSKRMAYNAIRSSHYPCSKDMLDACDRQGMLMMDEYVDVWYIHKTKYDICRISE